MSVDVVDSGLDRWGAPWALYENDSGVRWLHLTAHRVPWLLWSNRWYMRLWRWLKVRLG